MTRSSSDFAFLANKYSEQRQNKHTMHARKGSNATSKFPVNFKVAYFKHRRLHLASNNYFFKLQ